MNQSSSQRGRWSSGIGFILASAGAAVGLGNIQRFPYVVSENGGSAFVVVYLMCIILLALPLMLVEFAIGRHTQRNPMCAIVAIRPNSRWRFVGSLGILTAFSILSYYSVIGGWTLAYFVGMLSGDVPELEVLTTQPVPVIGYMLLFLGIVVLIVRRGVRSGIEKASKLLMPLLLLILLMLTIRSVTFEGSEAGLAYYLKPDFSKITAKTLIFALSQAFFSLSIGEAVLVTYGSYASKRENLFSSAIYIALFDTMIALIAGLIVFPALFAFDHANAAGIGITFEVLPKVFQAMPFGVFFGCAFFALLAFASLTTGIALLEIPVIYLIDAWGFRRNKAVIWVALAAFVVGLPSALSGGISPFFTSLTLPQFGLHGFYEIMDFLWGGLGMSLGGGLLAVFVGWVWGAERAAEELHFGSLRFGWYKRWWMLSVRYIAPILILCIFISMFF